MGPKIRLLLFVAILVTLYSFTCSLSLLSRAFQLISSKLSQGALLSSLSLTSPVLGLALGILATALVQSSSATTSLVVAIVASGSLTVQQGIPVIMGTNIGTSLTSTIVALYNIKEREEFRLGFSAAIIHDLFNWMTVMVLLPLEMLTGFLHRSSQYLVLTIFQGSEPSTGHTVYFLHAIIDPIVDAVVILKPPGLMNCSFLSSAETSRESIEESSEELGMEEMDMAGLKMVLMDLSEEDSDESGEDVSEEAVFQEASSATNNSKPTCSILATNCEGGCSYLFSSTQWSDEAVGGVILLFTIFIFIGSFVLMVRSLKALLHSRDQYSGSCLTRHLTSRLLSLPGVPGVMGILCGFLATLLIQSSSVVTSAMVPLVSQGTVSLELAYAVTVGSNLGTTTTSLLAALASGSQNTRLALQLALCHCIFNVCGITLFFIIPFMRWPLFVAKIFGSKVLQYKWFSIFYLIMSFFIIPLIILCLSLINTVLLYIITCLSCLLLALVILINFLQSSKPSILPEMLQDWTFLPVPLRSFTIIDYIVQTYMEVFCCCIVERTVMFSPMISDELGKRKGNVLNLGLGANLQLVTAMKK